MGEMVMDVGFGNFVLETIRDALLNQPFYNLLPPFSDSLKIIYDGTGEESPTRRLLVDVWVRGANETWVSHMGSPG
jgi:hypothetical protein